MTEPSLWRGGHPCCAHPADMATSQRPQNRMSVFIYGVLWSVPAENSFCFFLRGCMESRVNVGRRGHKRKTLGVGPSLSTLKQGLLFPVAQTRRAVLRASGDSPASVSHFSTGVQGMWRYAPPCLAFCGSGDLNSVFLLAQQALYSLNHLPILLLRGSV